MKYNVIRRFRDKYTGEIYLPGDTFTSDEASRIKDLLDRGLIEVVQQDHSSLTKKELIALLDEKGIEYSERQTKAELIELLGGG
jgi:hypothetical protein